MLTAPTLKRDLPGIDAVEIDEALEQRLERRDVVEGEVPGVAAGMKIGGGMRGLKNSGAPHSMTPMARN